jgi:glycosyltransferase involved in cell wall biosynthesis
MSTCLFLAEYQEIFSPTDRGGMALAYGHLQLLSSSNISIVLGIMVGPNDPNDDDLDISDLINKLARKDVLLNTIYFLPSQLNQKVRWSVSNYLSLIYDPAAFRYSDLIHSARIKALHDLIIKVASDFIWAEDLISATLAQRTSTKIPIIYSHHDWKWRIKQHRLGTKSMGLKKRFLFWVGKRHEESLVRQVAGCVSASVTETDEIRKIGAQCAAYFPAIYSPIDLPEIVNLLSHPRLVHLGGMQTTANQLGLQRFLEVSWPTILKNIVPTPELWVIGSLTGASPKLLSLLQQENITCTGFVADLHSVLRPFDIHIIPWEYNTGTRTRIPLVLNHSQVLLSTRAAASCLPELQSGQNCVLVDDLQEMADVIPVLYDDLGKRTRIAQSGREAFMNFFTRQAQQARFNEFVRNVSRNTQSGLAIS